jgi:heat shock protein HslJ
MTDATRRTQLRQNLRRADHFGRIRALARNLPELRARTKSGCAAAAVLAVALAGCTALPAPSPTPASTPLATPIAKGIPIADLVGAWHLTSYSTDGVATDVTEVRDTLFVFDNGRLVEKSHCAAFNGYYIPADGTLTLRNDLAVHTGCMSNVIPGHLISAGFTMHLSNDDSLTLTSTTIELKKPDPEKFRPASVYTYERSSTEPGAFPPLSKIELPAPPIPVTDLVGEWKLAEYVTVGGVRVTVNDPEDSVLFFANGRLYDTALCDTFRGDYTEGDGTLYFTNEITSQLECYNATGSGHVWATGVRITLDGDELTFESTTARDSGAPDQATYDGAAQIFRFHRISDDPGPEPKH